MATLNLQGLNLEALLGSRIQQQLRPQLPQPTQRTPSASPPAFQPQAPRPTPLAATGTQPKERNIVLQEALARERANPNPTEQTFANIQSFETELAQIGQQTGQSELERSLGFFDQASPEDAVETQSQFVRDIFGGRREQDVRALNDIFNQQRGSALDEAAVTGNLRQPGFQTSLVQGIDANRGQALQDLFAQLSTDESGALLGVQQRGQDIGLDIARSKAGLISGESQFGRGLGLSERQFSTESGLAQRQQSSDELFRNASLAEQVRGRQDRGKTSLFDKVSKGLGLANQFVSLAGGVQGLRKKKQGP